VTKWEGDVVEFRFQTTSGCLAARRCLKPAPTQSALRTLEWIHRRENLVVARR
jgi:hypothetical protein